MPRIVDPALKTSDTQQIQKVKKSHKTCGLMRIVNEEFASVYGRPYCTGRGTIQDRRAAESIFKNVCNSDTRFFRAFVKAVFREWETCATLEWAREKDHPLAKAVSLVYIASKWQYFLNDVSDMAYRKAKRRRGR